jgi:hypothetical protein
MAGYIRPPELYKVVAFYLSRDAQFIDSGLRGEKVWPAHSAAPGKGWLALINFGSQNEPRRTKFAQSVHKVSLAEAAPALSRSHRIDRIYVYEPPPTSRRKSDNAAERQAQATV